MKKLSRMIYVFFKELFIDVLDWFSNLLGKAEEEHDEMVHDLNQYREE